MHRKDLPGKPDMSFPSRRKVIFVHGCFWHGHGCKIGRLPKSRPEFWVPKIRLLITAADTGKRADIAAATGQIERVLRDRRLL